ncbi:MAG TPA: PEPxxWA-CTERM sorting domain-containing protein [Stellaceae bacterium]|nr:PEPxxWA-CTERM sorting domain-containing protein [Stellaceae bacterium]
MVAVSGVRGSIRTICGAGFGLALGVIACASAAQANVYELNVACSGCGSTGIFGTITTTDVGTNLQIDIALDPSMVFFNHNQNANMHALAFDVVGAPTLSLVGSLPQYFAFESLKPGTIEAPPFTKGSGNATLEYAIDYTPPKGKNAPPSDSDLVFTLAGLNVNSIAPDDVTCGSGCLTIGDYTIYFVSDVSVAGNTGNVAAIQLSGHTQGGVPEPATWAMMIVGFGLVGVRLSPRGIGASRTSV